MKTIYENIEALKKEINNEIVIAKHEELIWIKIDGEFKEICLIQEWTNQ